MIIIQVVINYVPLKFLISVFVKIHDFCAHPNTGEYLFLNDYLILTIVEAP